MIGYGLKKCIKCKFRFNCVGRMITKMDYINQEWYATTNSRHDSVGLADSCKYVKWIDNKTILVHKDLASIKTENWIK